MALTPIPRSLLTTHHFQKFFQTPTPRLLSAAADHYYDLLLSNSSHPNLERTLHLSTTATPVTATVVLSVLRRLPSPSLLGLRFFVWSALRPNQSLSAAALSAAASALRLSRHPHSLHRLLDLYAAAASPVSLKTFKLLLSLSRAANLTPDIPLSLLPRIPLFGCRPDTPTFNSVLRLLPPSRSPVLLQLLADMKAAGLTPDMVTHVSAVKCLCAADRLDEAKSLVEQTRLDGCVPNVVLFSALLHGACQCNDLDSAMQILEEMERSSIPNVVTYTCLIKCLCDKGCTDSALGVFDRMGIHGCSPNMVTISILLSGFCDEGRVGDAFGVVEKVVTEGIGSSEECYSLLVVSLLRAGKVDEGEGLVERMFGMGVGVNGAARNSLMREICTRRRFVDGCRWVEKLEEGFMCVDSDVYSLLLAGLCEDECFTEAVMLGRKIVEKGVRLERANVDRVVEVLRRIGELDLALQIMHEP